MSRHVGWILVLALVGCADVVVEDGDGDRGGDGDGDGDGQDAGSGEPAGVGGASAEDSEIPLGPCARLCDASTDAGCAVAGLACLDRCVAGRSFSGGCLATYDAWVGCRAAIAGAAVCDAPGTACPEEWAAYEACVTPPGNCDERLCAPDVDGTSCLQMCGGRAYETECAPTDVGFTCNCFVDGELVGLCEDRLEPTTRCCDHAFQHTR